MIDLGFSFGFLLGVFLVSLRTIQKCFFRVEEGHLGVLITFGKAEFSDASKHVLRTWGPGLHTKLPWQVVQTVSTMEQSLDLSGKEGGIMAMASDGTIVRLDSRLRYAPVIEELYDFLFAMKNPIPHIKGLFTCLLRNEIANFKNMSTQPNSWSEIGSYSTIRRQRKRLNQTIEDFTREKIGGKYGLRFDAVDLMDILPPDELNDALNAVMHAQVEAHSLYARTENECQQRVLSAKEGISIAEKNAKAIETEILTLGKYLEKLHSQGMLSHYLRRRKSETFLESRAVFVRS